MSSELIGCQVYDAEGQAVATVHDLHFRLRAGSGGSQVCQLDALECGKTLHVSLLEMTDHVIIEFRDEGCGMTPDVIGNLFEPFFTSKQPGQGTGLVFGVCVFLAKTTQTANIMYWMDERLLGATACARRATSSAPPRGGRAAAAGSTSWRSSTRCG